MDSRNRRRAAGTTLALLTLVALVLRGYGLGRLDFWYDEIVLWEYSLTGNVLFVPTEAPLMSWLVLAAMWWTGSAEALVFHLVPAALGTLAVPLTFFLVSKASGSRLTGLVGAALVTLSPMAIHYSREGRPYALLMILSAAAYAALYWARQGGNRWAWPAFSLSVFLCSMTHLLAAHLVLVAAVHATLELLRPPLEREAFWRRVPLFLRAGVFAALGWIPGTLWFLQRYRTDPAFDTTVGKVLDTLYPHGLLAFGRDVIVNLGGGASGSRFEMPWQAPEWVGLGSLLLVVAGLVRLARKGESELLSLLGLAISIPLVIEFATLGWKGSFDWMRYLSHLLIPYLTLAALGIAAGLERVRSPAAASLLALLLLAALAPRSVRYVERPEYQTYRAIATHLRENREQLAGVLIPPTVHHLGSADRRITHIYHYLKRETLPVYLLVDGTLRPAALEPSRGGITELARPGDDAVTGLPSGRYAILVRRQFASCEEVPSWIEGLDVTAGKRSDPIPGLVICDLENASRHP